VPEPHPRRTWRALARGAGTLVSRPAQALPRTFDRRVDGLSVTPFTSRAASRGLSGVPVALARNLGPEQNPKPAAGLVDRADPVLRAAVEAILRREREIASEGGGADDIESEVERRLAVG
jgi:hypothetical protein